MDKNQRISQLIAASLLGQLTAEGREELGSWLQADARHRQLYESLAHDGSLGRELSRVSGIDGGKALRAMTERIERAGSCSGRSCAGQSPDHAVRDAAPAIRRWMAAAAVVLAVAGGAYVAFRHADKPQPTVAAVPAQITHGSTRACIILDDGRQISLGSDIAADRRAMSRISREGYDGRVTMRTPRGGEFAMTLPDSTEVRLNAESSISYPAAFDGDVRRVSVSGEAYFRVRHDANWPFEVEAAGQTLRVLGTEFNINAYDRSHILTTLFSGSVAVKARGGSEGFVLAPGQTSDFSSSLGTFRSVDADTAAVRGWLHGRFVFENQSLGRIMRELGRWYDFDYRFADRSLASTVFMGTVPRYGDFREVLDILEKSGGISFAVSGKTVTVRKMESL